MQQNTKHTYSHSDCDNDGLILQTTRGILIPVTLAMSLKKVRFTAGAVRI